jgi:hypothetical protein
VKASIVKSALMFLILVQSATAMGQAISFPELLQKRDEWPMFAADGRKLQFEGRFEGRTVNTIRITKFDIVCNLPSKATFPDNIKDGQRIEVIGHFLSDNGKLVFIVSRILIKETDIDRLRSRAREVPTDQPQKLLDLAAEYQPDAEFYEDAELKSEIAAIRIDCIRRLRTMARGDVAKLTELLQHSKTLGIRSELIQLLQFEQIYMAAKEPNVDVDALLATMMASCSGWDQIVPPIPVRLQHAFDKVAVDAFMEASETDRKSLHRLLYKSLRLRQFHAKLKSDGSNGLDLSRMVRTEFGENEPLAAEFEDLAVQHLMTKVASLSRADLKGLTELLSRLNRTQQIPDAVRDWLRAQEQKFGTSDLAGLIRTADEYLFAADMLRSEEYRQQGIEFLKRAWTNANQSSPTDAEQIADRLNRLGWERLNDAWMTKAQIESLPKDNVQLAIREGRVVRGMTVEQVVQTLGQPTRISRIASRRSVSELWNFEAERSTRIVVRFRRSIVDSNAASIVEDVSRVP